MGIVSERRQTSIMYRVQGTMRENYYGADTEADMPRKSNLEAPRVTLNNKRMTNIQLPGGEVVQGIRGNKDMGYDGAPEAAYEPPLPLKPLRYDPGLKCDAALEAMRPERNPKHKSISAGDRRQMPAELAPVEQPEFQQPMMQPQYMPMMVPAQPMIEQDLNMTRRATRPFVPQEDAGYFELQKPVHELETMPQTAIRPVWFNADEFLRVEELPPPKKVQPKEPEPEKPKPAVMRQVGIADQIAIRSYVLGKTAKTSE